MTTQPRAALADILLVEDNPGDVRLLLEALKEAGMKGPVTTVDDGVEATELLYRRGKYSKAARPGLILLDLNLPRMDGRQVLAQIKADPDLRRIPILVLTTSRAPEDVRLAYDLGANCYIQKPIDLDDFVRVVRSIEDFWLRVVELPTE